MNPPRRRKVLTTQEKQKLLDNFTISPLSSQKFATQNGIGHSTLMRWRRESSVDANCNPTNRPSTPDTENLFFELTAPLEYKLHTDIAHDFAQKSSPTKTCVNCVIAIPNGITITVESIKTDQLAQIVQGLLP